MGARAATYRTQGRRVMLARAQQRSNSTAVVEQAAVISSGGVTLPLVGTPDGHPGARPD